MALGPERLPPKDLDAQETTFFTTDSKAAQYMICFYYATLLIVGNESAPQTVAFEDDAASQEYHDERFGRVQCGTVG